MKKYKNFTIKEYLEVLSRKEPVPGGGSAAALTAALGVGLITMVANYSKAKSSSKVIEKKTQKIIRESEKMKDRLLELVDLDAQAYMGIVEAKNGSAK
ncbi:MAG: cyclodeaminase/cyclohydrolase family protein, partial [Candidatus Omnitrophica bacterium]|nr:cyclodeaminase/cyclohydrolase family protein [Candidatus Omnitrophota bacterium]